MNRRNVMPFSTNLYEFRANNLRIISGFHNHNHSYNHNHNRTFYSVFSTLFLMYFSCCPLLVMGSCCLFLILKMFW